MIPPNYAFELLSDGSVEIFNRNTGHPAIVLTREQMHKLLQWWLVDKMTLQEIVKQLKHCGYTCIAGPLELNVAFIALCEMAERTE